MTIKWKLFGIANYIMLLVYGFLFLGAIRFTVEEVSSDADLSFFILFMASLFFAFLNSILNLYVFHIHLPDKPLSRRRRRIYFISAILYSISISIITISPILDLKEEFTSAPIDNSVYFLLIICFLIFLIGLFILVNQFMVNKFIETKYNGSLNSDLEK